jgi:toxin secretion/phage lysis holin
MVVDRLEGSWHWIVAVVFAPLALWFTSAMGGWTDTMRFLTTAILVDIATGVLRSIKQKSLSSSICLDGIIKKVGYFLLVLLCEQVGQAMGQSHTIRDMVVLGLIVAEGLSVFENLVAIDVWIPEGLRDQLRGVLAQLNGKKGGPTLPGGDAATEERLDRYVARE